MNIDPFKQPVNPMGNRKLNEEQEKIIRDLQLEHDQKLLSVFNSTEGDALLDAWDDFYVRQPVFVNGNNGAWTTEMREGRNAFIRAIRAKVNTSRGLK